MLELSYSKIYTYDTCPFKYKWIYVDNKPYNHGVKYHEARLMKAVLDGYHKCLYQRNRNVCTSSEYANKLINEIYSIILPEKSLNRIMTFFTRYTLCDKWFDSNDFETIGYFPQAKINEYDVRLSGRFDLLVNKHGQIKLIDFTWSDKLENETWDMIYTFLLYSKYQNGVGLQIEKYFMDNNSSRNVLICDQEEAKEYIYNKIQIIRGDITFEPKKNDSCEYCNIANECNVKRSD